MAEYIDREKLLKHLEETNASDEWIVNQYNADWIYSFIESQPCANVVEVVRCKNCELYSGKYCRLTDDTEDRRVPDDYCSYGERRDTE